jgi:hypothetical protein
MAVPDQLQQIVDDRRGGVGPLVEVAQGGADDRLLVVSDRSLPAQLDQPGDQGDRAGDRLAEEVFPGLPTDFLGGGDHAAGVTRVERPAAAAADCADFAAELGAELGVVGFGVPGYEQHVALGDKAEAEFAGQGGLAQTWFAHDEHGRVGDQAGLKPADVVEAHDLTRALVPPDRGTGQR